MPSAPSFDGGADLVVIGFEAEDPTGYGRLLLDEQRTARRHPRGEGRQRRGARAHALQFRHHGLPLGQDLLGLLGRIGNDNAKNEFYLTDAVALARGDRLEARMVKSNGEEVLGVNSRGELARPKR